MKTSSALKVGIGWSALVVLGAIICGIVGAKIIRTNGGGDLLRKAQSGDPEAQFKLARMYEKGSHGLNADPEKAFHWYAESARNGNAKAQNNLGTMYASGLGVKQDDPAAFRSYRQSAEQGDSVAENNLGAAYESGRGVPQNYSEALAWYHKSANQGNARAQFNLGRLCYQGKGISPDAVSSYMWLILAKANGYKRSGYMMKILALNLTRTQIAEAQRLASEWQTGNKEVWLQRPKAAESRPTGLHSRKQLPPAEEANRSLNSPSRPHPERRMQPTVGCEDGHWVESASEDGEIVKLENGSVWTVDSSDAVDSALWLPSEGIVACDGYLINADTNERVDAERIR